MGSSQVLLPGEQAVLEPQVGVCACACVCAHGCVVQPVLYGRVTGTP